MNEQALTVKATSAVTPWATRQDVRELEERLRTMLPGAQKLNALELFGLAQAAIAHNLDPFNGELWCIPGKGLMAGIKGHRRAAHRQINDEAGGNGNYYVEFFQLSVDEMTALKIPPKSLAFRARLHDSQTTRAYVENIERMLKAGMPWDVVSKIMGDQPYTEGIGYYVDGEQTKMTPVQCSQKRAEADALKRRFDLPFTMAIGVNGDADVVDAEFAVGQPEQDPAEVQAKMQAASKSLRGDQGDLGPNWNTPPEPTEPAGNGNGKAAAEPTASAPQSNGTIVWPTSLLNQLVMHYKGGNIHEYKARLAKSAILKPDDNFAIIAHWMNIYNTERTAGIEPDEAARRADADRQATKESA